MTMMWGALLGFGFLAFLLSHLLVTLVAVAVVIWLHWRILKRMGFPPHLSLLLLLFLVPALSVLALLSYIAALWLLAYRSWPAAPAARGAAAVPGSGTL